MAKFSEHDVGLPGVDIAIKPVRSYVYGALAAHILGYVGAPDDTNKDEARKYTFYQGDVEGKSNVEKSMDEYLRGTPGVRYLRRNAKGVIDGVLREDPPKQGANVFLTIDARIQAVADEALRAVSRGAAWLSIQTTATFWRWHPCRRSIRIPSFRASRRRIGKHCKRTRPIRWSIARSARCRQARHSSSSRRSPDCGHEKSSERANSTAVAA